MNHNKRMILLEKCPEGKITKENLFVNLFSDMEIKTYKETYINRVFFNTNSELVFTLDNEQNIFFIYYNKAWSVLINEYDSSYLEINSLIQSAMKKHFKMDIKYYMEWRCCGNINNK